MAKLNLIMRFKRLNTSKIILALGTLIIFNSSIKAGDNKLVDFLSIPIPGDTTFTFSVKPGADLLLPFVKAQSTNIGATVELYLSDFKGEFGDNIAVEPYIVELPKLKPKNQRLLFKLDKSVMTLKLKIPELPTAGKYIGNLIISKEGNLEQKQSIVLTRAVVQRPAQLTTDLKSINIQYTNSFTILVRNASPDWEAKGIFLRLLEITTPKGTNFDPGENLSFKWNDTVVSDIWYSSSLPDKDTAQRVIAPNQQAKISGEFIGLSPGEYTLKIGIATVNGTPESEQQVTLKVEVRDSIWCAILILFAGIIIAFIANKVLNTLYSRSDILKRISQIRPPWLREAPDTLPVVSVRTILKQAEDRSRNIWVALFTTTDVINDRLTQAENILKIVNRLRILREKINNWIDDKMIKYRADKQLSKIEADLGWEIGDEKFVEEMKIKLESLEKWDNPDQRYILFWNDLKEDIEILCAQAQPESFGSLQNEEKSAITKLNKNLEKLIKDIDNQFKENKDDHLNEKIVIAGHAYARLKLLQESKINDDKKLQGKLIEMLKEDPWPSVEDFWVKADEMTWGKIERACEDNEIEFTSPHINEIQPICKFQLIQFNIFPKNKALGNNYLFKKGLEYLWTLDIERKKLFGKVEVKRLTDPRTNEPRLVQYVPVRGKLKVAVELRRNGIPAKEKIRRAHPLIIKGSEDFGFLGAFSTAEVTALAIAALFAIVSGLSAFYISNSTFGRIDDYFKLFIWGAGVDLGKNFIQQLQLTSKGSGATK